MRALSVARPLRRGMMKLDRVLTMKNMFDDEERYCRQRELEGTTDGAGSGR